jgi:hypothetical protein
LLDTDHGEEVEAVVEQRARHSDAAGSWEAFAHHPGPSGDDPGAGVAELALDAGIVAI